MAGNYSTTFLMQNARTPARVTPHLVIRPIARAIASVMQGGMISVSSSCVGKNCEHWPHIPRIQQEGRSLDSGNGL